MTRWFLLAVWLAASACRCPPASEEGALLPEVRRILAERDKRLSSYRLAATSTEGGAEAAHEFAFRSPNRSLGTMLRPERVTLAFDGERLFRLEPRSRKLSVYELKLPVDQASLFLASTFTPFVPEGFRTPLLPVKGVTATSVTHPRGPQAVQLVVVTQEAGQEVRVEYTLRFPTGDFLGKRTTLGELVTEVVVDQEHCEAAFKFCVPQVLRHLDAGRVVHQTTLTSIELGVEIPTSAFTVTAPPGYEVERRELVEAPKG